MADDELTAAFKQASEIAKLVPQHLQEVAFNRALDQLLGAGRRSESSRQRERSSGGTRPGKRGPSSAPAGTRDKSSTEGDVAVLLQELDRTQYPEITADNKVLRNALALLRAAKRDHSIDGLQASQIARILTEKFRISTADSSVRMALGAAGKYVNRVPVGRGYVYRLMGPGETYLDSSEEGDGEEKRPAPRARPRRKAKSDAHDGSDGSPRSRSNAPRGRPGPKVAVDALIGAGFFATARTLGEIAAHLKVDRGYGYTLQDLSPTMVRSVRSGRLRRSRREDGQYEYQAG